MLKIKKDLNIKIISLVLAVVFSMHTTAYGRDLSSKSHLRIPLATNNVKTINRLQKTLAKQLMAEGKAALSVRELYPNAQNLAHAMADELELIAPEQYNELVNYWAVIWQGIYKNFPDGRDYITDVLTTQNAISYKFQGDILRKMVNGLDIVLAVIWKEFLLKHPDSVDEVTMRPLAGKGICWDISFYAAKVLNRLEVDEKDIIIVCNDAGINYHVWSECKWDGSWQIIDASSGMAERNPVIGKVVELSALLSGEEIARDRELYLGYKQSILRYYLNPVSNAVVQSAPGLVYTVGERLEEVKDRCVSEIQTARDEIGAFGGKKTSFGRNGKALNEVVSRVLDITRGDTVRILDVGASVGPEGYDIAFAAAEWLSVNGLKGRKKIEIIITDINPDNIAAAREGVYGEELFFPDDLMSLDKEKLNRRKEMFFIKEGTSYKVNIDRLREYGIELRYQVLDALDNKGFAQLSRDGKCDLVVCRNVHFDSALNPEPTDNKLRLEEILSERVWKNVASVLNNDGFAHMGYSITRILMLGLLREACLKIFTREEMQEEMNYGVWQYFKPKIFSDNFYTAAKLESGLRDIVITSKDENGVPYYSMDFTEFLEDFSGLATAFGYRDPILTSLILFYLDENISNEEKIFFNYWMKFVENREGAFSSLIIDILIKASGLLTEEGLQRFYNKLIELRVGKHILEDRRTRSMQMAVGSLALVFRVGKVGIPKWLYEKIINLDLTPVEKAPARLFDVSI